jgi:integrase
MSVALNALLDDDEDFRSHVAFHRASNFRPPYSDDLEITSTSTFGQMEWIYDRRLITAGHRQRNVINFLLPRTVAGGKKFRLVPTVHSILIQQLKETVYAFVYHRNIVRARHQALKPLTAIKMANVLCLLFANFAARGFKSLQDIGQQELSEIFANIPVGISTHDLLVGWVDDIVTLHKHGLISSGFGVREPHILPMDVAEDETREKGARTLTEGDTAAILSASRLYIAKHGEIADQLLRFSSGLIDRSQLAHWLYMNLPIELDLSGRSIASQVVWLVRMAGYNLFSYHLGSRASESLSIDGESVTSVTLEDGTVKTYLTLTIFKNTIAGKRRKYLVHPYLRQVAEALKSMNKAMGQTQSGLFFRHDDLDEEISASRLNQKIKDFALLHAVETEMTSHSWRYTLSDVVAGAAENPFHALQYQLDHEYLSESIGYGMHGPAGEDFRQSAVDGGLRSIESFLEACFASQELGGLQGLKIASSRKGGASVDDLRRELSDLSIIPLKVGEDRYCVKPAHARGSCSFATKDTNPEIEHCRADCVYQTQLSQQEIRWSTFIDEAPQFLKNPHISHFDKILKVDELKQNLVAWPQLENRLYTLLKDDPSLKIWFK